MRGKRFIPACAGNRFGLSSWACSLTVHPRVCGEQTTPTSTLMGNAGSSPRVRGTDDADKHAHGKRRFIPACAGNSKWGAFCSTNTAVHPRVCGEQALSARFQISSNGSSPRVRGTGAAGLAETNRQRFIPACAGNRGQSETDGQQCSVHPRVCGEQTQGDLTELGQAGSSPRVRGTVEAPVAIPVRCRFIPACAGNRWTIWIR